MKKIFSLDPHLAADTLEVGELKLCKVLLMNNSFFPWLILVPKEYGVTEITDLTSDDRLILIEEISLVSKVMQKLFVPDKLNIAAIGNIVPQLHVHIVARYKNDSAWPEVVFGKAKKPYPSHESRPLIDKLKKLLQPLF